METTESFSDFSKAARLRMYSQDLKSESNDSSPPVGEVASSVEVVETSDKAGVPVTEVSGRLPHFLDVFFSFDFAFDLCHICNICMLHRVLDFILFCFAYLIMEFSKPAVCLLIQLMPAVLGNPEMDL